MALKTQFQYRQNYQYLLDILGNSETKKLAHNTYIVKRENCVAVTYHGNTIILVNPDNSAIIRNAGYETVTTKARLNQFTPNGVTIWQNDWTWYIQDSMGVVETFDNGKYINQYGELMS